MLKPYCYQQEIIFKFDGLNKIGLFLDMGLGKTLIACELFKREILGNETILIVCKKSIIDNWSKFLFSQYGKESIILNKQNVHELEGNVILTNYELLWRRPEIIKVAGINLILDEAQYIKNRNTQIGKFIGKLCYNRIILLSGTPTGGKYDDLYNLFFLLGYEIKYKTFTTQYCVYERIEGSFRKKAVAYKNIDRLKDKVKDKAIFLKTNEVLELPEQTENFIEVNITCFYQEFKKDKITDINGLEFVGDNQSKFMIYKLYLAGAYNIYKNNALKDLLGSTNDRIIIFYNFHVELEKIVEIMLEMDKIFCVLNGEYHNLETFENNENCVLISQYQAGAVGHNFQYCNLMLFYSLPWSYSLYSQAKKRIHRLGQKKGCFYYYLIAKGTIDEDIYYCLKNKNDYDTKIFEK